MELVTVVKNNCETVVLLDDGMKIIEPVYNYLKYLKLKNRAVNTLKANGMDLKIYWRFLNNKGLNYKDITPMDIGEFIEYLRETNSDEHIVSIYKESQRTSRTINRILSTIYNFYRYCGMMQEISNPIIINDIERPHNMFRGLLEHTKRNNKTRQSIFKVKESKTAFKLVHDNEAMKFLENLPTWRDKIIFKIMYMTGARIGEVLDLQIENIPYPDISKNICILENIKSKGKRRNLYVPMSLVEEIDKFIMEVRSIICTEHGYIFISQQKQYEGKPLTYRGIYEVFNTVKKKTGISFNFHDLRHTLISHLVESGMDISVVRIIAGHEHVSTTQQYTHISDKYLENKLNKYWEMSVLFGGGLHDN